MCSAAPVGPHVVTADAAAYYATVSSLLCCAGPAVPAAVGLACRCTTAAIPPLPAATHPVPPPAPLPPLVLRSSLQPCLDQAGFLGALYKCGALELSGRAAPSACGDGLCFVEAAVNGALVWIPDHLCGTADTLVGAPDACPAPATAVPAT